MSEPSFTRRRFLQALPLVAGAVLGAGRQGFADTATTNWVSLGSATNFPKGSIKRVQLPAAENSEVVFIVHQPNDTILGLWGRCTHHGCVIDWDQPDQKFVCPCHHGQFDTAGNVLAGPPKKPLVHLATKTDTNGNLLVQAPPVQSQG